MATSTEHLEDPELLQTEWDLSPLVDGDEQAGVDRLLDEATERAEAFSAAYAGKMAELDADGLAQAMHDLETINEVVGRRARTPRCASPTDTADQSAAPSCSGCTNGRPRSRPSCCSSSSNGPPSRTPPPRRS